MGSIPGLERFYTLQGNQAQVPQLLSLRPRACALEQGPLLSFPSSVSIFMTLILNCLSGKLLISVP